MSMNRSAAGFAHGITVGSGLAGAVTSRLCRQLRAQADRQGVLDQPLPMWKRAMDLGIIFLLSPALLVIFAALAAYIKLVSSGPVFFTQERIGLRGRAFRCFKFRTMHADNDVGVHMNHLAELINSNRPMKKLDAADKRIIPLGAILRSSGLDELPQLINVLRGEMSVIGPRPCTRYEYDLYEPWQKQRFTAVPGLTGLWQVSGKNRTTFNEMVCLDIRYADNLSLRQDLRILAKTLPTLLGQVREHLRNRRPKVETVSWNAGAAPAAQSV
ncbi:MAG: sugar transferase [Verrucomicrobia bacterium]|nr:sugar transferase [Verrucomicrobiota bacterium]